MAKSSLPSAFFFFIFLSGSKGDNNGSATGYGRSATIIIWAYLFAFSLQINKT